MRIKGKCNYRETGNSLSILVRGNMSQNNNFLKSIEILVDKKLSKYCADKTFPSVVYDINSDGTYAIVKAGQKYNVKCCIPSLPISLGSNVWVKVPSGRMQDMHICGLR